MKRVASLIACVIISACGGTRPGVLEGPRPTTPTPVQLQEQIEVDCRGVKADGVCQIRGVYRLENPTPEAQVIIGAVQGLDLEGVSISVDGAPAARPLSEAERARLAGASPDLFTTAKAPVTRAGFEARVPGSGAVTLTARGRLAPQASQPDDWLRIASVHLRHPYLSSPEFAERRIYDLDYLQAPHARWGVGRSGRLTLRAPAGWGRDLAFVEAPRWRSRVEAKRHEVRGEAREGGIVIALPTSPSRGRLAVTLEEPAPTFIWGGPVLGIGVGVDREEAPRWVGRLAYEVAAPDWLLYAVALDARSDERLVAAPSVTMTSPGLLFIPISVGLGVGAPVLMRGEPEVGVRAQVYVNSFLLGGAISLDLFPGLASDDPEFYHLSYLFTVSL